MFFSRNRGLSNFYKYLLVGLTSLIMVFAIVIYLRRRSKEVSEESFVTGTDGNTIYFFRANWCGHCQRFKPTWDSFVDRCNKSDEHQNLEIVELDVDKEESKPLLQKYNVRGFPTVILVDSKGDVKHFQDERTEEALMKFVS